MARAATALLVMDARLAKLAKVMTVRVFEMSLEDVKWRHCGGGRYFRDMGMIAVTRLFGDGSIELTTGTCHRLKPDSANGTWFGEYIVAKLEEDVNEGHIR